MTWWTTIIFLFLTTRFLVFVSSEYWNLENLCKSQDTCSKCLQTPQCVWCSMTIFGQNVNNLDRCVSKETYQKKGDLWCLPSNVVDKNSTMEITEDRMLSSKKGKVSVQIQPQRIRLRLRRGEKYRVTVKYSQAEDYPVDLYYLMDLSYSMEPYRDKLSKLGLQLAKAMQNLTSNFRIGFGSFVDKVILPMTSTQPDKLKSPCNLRNKNVPCAPPYNYKNQMPLTENITLFKDQVQAAPVSGNLDTPEGGFDALMQVMVCTKEIGWRQKARHLIVFSTDATYHIAGDGKLAGIIEPNDCMCHLDKKGFYSYSLLQDYPSISQINRKAREHDINIIFAVSPDMIKIYNSLSRSISGSSTGTLKDDSQNVVALVSSEYEKLVSSLEMIHTAPKIIDVKYFTRCLNQTGDLRESQKCEGLRVGNVVEFEVELNVIECPEDPKDWNQTVEIKPRGLNENLIIDVEIICDCSCERPEHSDYRPNAAECRNSGTLVCGICDCNSGFYGKQCECIINKIDADSPIFMDDCKADNQTTEICSGHGSCICGVCECEIRPNSKEIFYGQYCECDNFSCKRNEGKICGGRERGNCVCGTCDCIPPWGGEACECKQSNNTCISPPRSGETVKICSGRGECICGKCHCHERNHIRFSGEFCEECTTCPAEQCKELKDCVECMAYNAGPLVKNGECNLCKHEVIFADVIEENQKDEETEAHICEIKGDEDCMFKFKYQFHKGDTRDNAIFKIQTQRERTCTKAINTFGVALGVVVSTVVIGSLILLMWKLFTIIHDKREYARFERERALAKWDRGENPLYKQATSTFSNPTFDETANNE
nr:PREDICTED: integrin beta-PS-like [Linepithema humile]